MKYFVLISGCAMVLGACGPQASDFVGNYSVHATETIENCEGGEPHATEMESATSLRITERTDTIINIDVESCSFRADVVEDGVFEGVDGVCEVSYEAPEIEIEFSSRGQLDGSSIEVILDGTYKGSSDYGLLVTCDYRLVLSSEM